MYCLLKEDKVRCCHCGNMDVHWQHVSSSHDCYSYVDNYCKHHSVHWKCKWEQCSYNIDYCSPLPIGVIVYTVYGSLWNAGNDCTYLCSLHDDPVIKTVGTVKSFSKESVTGYVEVGGKLYRFPSTCFVCHRTPRYPMKDENVNVMIRNINGEDVVIAMSSIK